MTNRQPLMEEEVCLWVCTGKTKVEAPFLASMLFDFFVAVGLQSQILTN